MIDAHVHVWSLCAPGHEWPTAAEAAIHRDFDLDDLRAVIGDLPVEGVVLVQSQPNDGETDRLLDLAARDTLVQGVVGWVDLAAPAAAARIGDLARNAKLRGLRPMLQGIEDTDWLLAPALEPAIAAMRDHGLRLDALVQPRHLPMLARFAAAWPDLPIVIDHGAKPYAATGTLDPWRGEIAALAARGLWCKLSGLRTEQAAGQPADALRPYVAHLAAYFGDRLMWGSDWPVIGMAGERYRDWYDAAIRLAGGLDRTRLMQGAARAFYGLA
ncbi:MULTISPECIES: amidohydrolase [Sphingomonas]|jgi:L-fuconolactonase|uniref:amidohydrolase family protein n=1 Tax=Sphingomonas TaxID=13687 RepID=UPI001AEE9C0C|nr:MULTISPECIES: amidohydrolase family protein [Sphingomonas]